MGGPQVTSDLGHPPALVLPLLLTSDGQHVRPVQTCSLEESQESHVVVATEVHTVCKQVVYIQLECFHCKPIFEQYLAFEFPTC